MPFYGEMRSLSGLTLAYRPAEELAIDPAGEHQIVVQIEWFDRHTIGILLSSRGSRGTSIGGDDAIAARLAEPIDVLP
jgi:hypothetical protein